MGDYRLYVNGVVPIFEAVGCRFIDLADVHRELYYTGHYSTWIQKKLSKAGMYIGKQVYKEPGSANKVSLVRRYAYMMEIKTALRFLDAIGETRTKVFQFLQRYKNIEPDQLRIVEDEETPVMSNVVVMPMPTPEPEENKMKLVQTGLVPIYERENQDTAVDARELHLFLEIQAKFADWVKNRIEDCGLAQNVDYATYSKILEKGRPSIEYALTIDAAKHIAMIERNEKGKQARQYFIDFEKKARTPQPLALSGDFGTMLIQAGQQIQQQNLVITTLTQEKEELKIVANQLAMDNITVQALINDKDLIGLREAAKIFKLFGDDTKALTVIRAMHELGWIYKLGKDSPNLPKSTLEAKGYFKTIMPKCNGEEREQAKFTPKGMMWAYPKLCIHFGSPLDPLVQQYIQSLIDKQSEDTPPAA